MIRRACALIVFLFLSKSLFPGALAETELPRVYALTNARVVTAPGKVIEKGTIVVRGGVIEAVGAAAAVKVPADAQVLDLEGKNVYPGLIDPYVTLGRLSGRRDTPADDASAPRRGAAPAGPAPVATPAAEVHWNGPATVYIPFASLERTW